MKSIAVHLIKKVLNSTKPVDMNVYGKRVYSETVPELGRLMS